MYLFQAFNRLLGSPQWILIFIVLGTMFACVVSPPRRSFVIFSDHNSFWSTVEKQAIAPMMPIIAEKGSHAASKAFRLTIPILAKVLHLKRKGIYVLQVCTLFVMMGISLALVYRITADRLISVLFLGALIPLYTIVCAYQEARAHLDAFAYCFLFCTLYFRNPYLIFISCTLASWCDERAFLATSLTFVWWYFQSPQDSRLIPRNTLTKPGPQALSVAVSGLCYMTIRIILENFTALHIPSENLNMPFLPQHIHLLPMLAYLTFGGLWLLLILAMFHLLKYRAHLLSVALLVPVSGLGMVAIMVLDFTRSLSFAFPGLYISLMIVHYYTSNKTLRPTMAVLLILAVITPQFYFEGLLHYLPSLLFRGLERFSALVP